MGGARRGAFPAPARPIARVSQPAVLAIVLAADALVLALAGAVAAGSVGYRPSSGLTLAIVFVIAATMTGLQRRWAYTIPALANLPRQVSQTGLWLFMALGALIVLHFLSGAQDPDFRRFLAYWFAGGWGATIAGRSVLRLWLAAKSRSGALARRTVIAGGGAPAATLIERLRRSGGTDIQILGLFDDRDAERSPETIGDLRKLGRFEELADFCREEKIDLIIIALPATAEDRILHLLKKLWALPVDVRVSALGSKLKLRDRAYAYIGDTPFLPLFDKPMSDWGHAVKTIEDKVLAAIALVLLSPLLAAVALAVRLESRGPILFRQMRYGFNNEPIPVLKFRSMYADKCDATANRLVTRDDPRVTRVGRFIRRTSIDELPQLINVLRGELSLVGPRPHAMQAKAAGHVYDEVVDGYFSRHRVKPGITGWAQIHGWRGETDTIDKIEQRVRYDLHYIDNWSVTLDLYILAMTPISLFTTRNAY